MRRRIRAFSLAFVLAVSSVIPVKQAYAWFPLPFMLSAVGAGGTVIASDLIASGVTALVGGSVMALILSISGDSSQNSVRVPTTTNSALTDAAMAPPVASSSAPPVVSGGLPSNASTVNAAWCTVDPYTGVSCGQITTLQTCITDYAQSFTGRSCKVVSSGDANYGVQYGACSGCTSPTGTTSCPSGYTLSGSSCNLSNPRLAVSDSKTDIQRSGATFTASTSYDKDALPAYSSVANGAVSASGTYNGKPAVVTVTPSADGSKTVVNYSVQSDSSTGTQVKSTAVTIDAATGQVISAQSGTATGAVTPATTANTAGTVSTGSAVTSGDLSINFPTDYARTGEAASAANTVKTAINDLADVSTASRADPEDIPASQIPDSFFKGSFDNLFGWSVPGHVSECPTADLSVNVFGSHWSLYLDAHCTIFEKVRPVLSTVMLVVWAVVALFIILGA